MSRHEDTNDTTDRIAGLLHEAGETHHRVFRIVDGADDDWPSWYADWLINLSELPTLLGRRPVRSELVYMLVRLDKEYTETTPAEPWPHWYATRLLEPFSRIAEGPTRAPVTMESVEAFEILAQA